MDFCVNLNGVECPHVSVLVLAGESLDDSYTYLSSDRESLYFGTETYSS